MPGLNLNIAMALDAENHRLLAGGWKPGKGRAIGSLDCIETADDMTFDPGAHCIYVTGSGGVTTVHEDDPDHFMTVAQFGTNAGKTYEVN